MRKIKNIKFNTRNNAIKRYSSMSVDDYKNILRLISLAPELITKSIPGEETFIDS